MFAYLTSLAIQVTNTAGCADAIRDRACLAVRHASAAGVRGRPVCTLQTLQYVYMCMSSFWVLYLMFNIVSGIVHPCLLGR